jgi:EpsI family protein
MRTRVLIVVAVLLGAAAAVAAANRPEQPVARKTFAEFPLEVADWSGKQEPPFTDEILKVLGVDDYLVRAYFAAPPDRAGVGLYIGYWGSQRQGDTIHSPLNCLPGSGWEPVSQSTVALPSFGDGTGPAPLANRYVVQKGLDKQYVLYWYQSHGRVVASEYWSKFFLVADAVRLNRTDGAIVRIIVAIDQSGDETTAERTALRFAKVLIPQLPGYLPN